MSSYSLSICDVDKERRNFPGVKIQPGLTPGPDEGGTTETDFSDKFDD